MELIVGKSEDRGNTEEFKDKLKSFLFWEVDNLNSRF